MLLVEAREKAVERELKVAAGPPRPRLQEPPQEADRQRAEGLRRQRAQAGDHHNHEEGEREARREARVQVKYDNSVNGFSLSNGDGTITLDAEMDRIVEQNTDKSRNVLSERLFGKKNKRV